MPGADDQGRDIAVQFHNAHVLPLGRDGAQQVLPAVEIRGRIVHR